MKIVKHTAAFSKLSVACDCKPKWIITFSGMLCVFVERFHFLLYTVPKTRCSCVFVMAVSPLLRFSTNIKPSSLMWNSYFILQSVRSNLYRNPKTQGMCLCACYGCACVLVVAMSPLRKLNKTNHGFFTLYGIPKTQCTCVLVAML